MAVASLAITVVAENANRARQDSIATVVGGLGMVACCVLAAVSIPGLHALRGSGLAWLGWTAWPWACTGRCSLAPAAHLDKLKEVRPQDYLVRLVLGAVISIGAGIVGKAVGARFGGMFLAFPAILPASLTLIQNKEGTRRADRDAIGAVLGVAGLVAFAAVGEASFGHLEPFAALPVAVIGWVVALALALYGLLAVLRPDDCDRAKD